LHSTDPLDQFRDPLDLSNAIAPNEHALGSLDPLNGLDVRALREHMRLTQREFAGWFGFPAATLRHWERGNRSPAGAALVLLHVIHENPRVVLQAVRKARMRGLLSQIQPRKSQRAPPGLGERAPALRPRGPRRR